MFGLFAGNDTIILPVDVEVDIVVSPGDGSDTVQLTGASGRIILSNFDSNSSPDVLLRRDVFSEAVRYELDSAHQNLFVHLGNLFLVVEDFTVSKNHRHFTLKLADADVTGAEIFTEVTSANADVTGAEIFTEVPTFSIANHISASVSLFGVLALTWLSLPLQ